ncbi:MULTISPECIES: hypothetical protein [Pseudomonas]|uniref:hypothetical protein n=1 Tax=Pseudomonas TaxID=286 RepID=UPI00055D04B9|nr:MULTISPECIES: hypothetical protein [Pseudomonas]MCW2267531.1 hypothetical protein [Pseudomonas sp. JUb96]PRA61154.1 hypothetical protein CQ065_17900 [Pseudomonas sp. MYb187]
MPRKAFKHQSAGKFILSFSFLYPAQAFKSHARLAQPFHTLARNDEMHEIPNLPFPSLNPEEQTPATHSAEPAQADHDGDDTSSADQE